MLPNQNKPRDRWLQCSIVPEIQRKANTNTPQNVPYYISKRFITILWNVAAIILVHKTPNDTTKKKNCLPISMNIYVKN